MNADNPNDDIYLEARLRTNRASKKTDKRKGNFFRSLATTGYMLLAGIGLTGYAAGCNGSNGSGDADTDTSGDSGTDSDTDTDTDTDTSVSAAIEGSVQKGPFVIGSAIQFAMLNSSGATTGTVYNTETTDSLGNFALSTDQIGYSQIIGNGYYFNEIANRLSGAGLTLRALYEIEDGEGQTAFLNVFTHMSSGRAQALFSGGMAFADAVAQAEGELYTALGVLHPDPANMGHGTSMDLVGADSPDNQYILAVSCIIDKAAQLDAIDDAEVDGKLQLLVNSISADIENDGAISDELKAKVRAGEASLNPNEDCVANLSAYLEQETGIVPDLPNPDYSADMDGDGLTNALDDDIDGDGVLNEDDQDSYDSSVLGGVWEDTTSGLMWQGAPAYFAWQDAIDYCDALELKGYDDWRLPQIQELVSFIRGCVDGVATGDMSLSECGVSDPDCLYESCDDTNCGPCASGEGPNDIDGCYFDPALNDCDTYWSSSSNATTADLAWVVSFNIADLTWDFKGGEHRVRCVRDDL
jgi:hypothetical protein